MIDNNSHEMIQEDLLSTALRYVLDELPPQERAAFERHLVEQQTAREAVAEAVLLCQAARQAIGRVGCVPDCVIPDAVLQNAEPDDRTIAHCVSGGPNRVQLASRHDRLWRASAAWAAMAVAASLVAAVVLTGIRGNQFGRAPMNPGSASISSSVDGRSSASESVANGEIDRRKQLAVAWLNFLPSPTEMALAADLSDADLSDAGLSDADSIDSDDAKAEGGALSAEESDALAGTEDIDEDIMARADSMSAASDWVYQAVTAEPASTATANPQEG